MDSGVVAGMDVPSRSGQSDGETPWTPSIKRGPGSALAKRVFDLILSAGSLLALLPALLIIALAIVIETPGPVLFRQRRTGIDGRVFTILKFRSMTVAEDGDHIAHATRDDKRVTRVGQFLRQTSLDELPQLINVLRGEMAIVGPRPHAKAHDVHYGRLLPGYNERFNVRPGLTGLAQIHGLRGEIHQLSCMARRVDADIAYTRTWSFRGDLLIILRTFPLLLKRVNAY
jgi:putative colanic acid biosynthesis UDP-glucose lipid carrier transferase